MTLQDELRALAEQEVEISVRKAKVISRLMAQELRGGDVRRVAQDLSPLGPRQHIAAARRRIHEEQEAGELPGTRGAYHVKRKYWLTQEALAEELARVTARAERKPVPVRVANDEDDPEALEERALAQMRGER